MPEVCNKFWVFFLSKMTLGLCCVGFGLWGVIVWILKFLFCWVDLVLYGRSFMHIVTTELKGRFFFSRGIQPLFLQFES